MLWPKKNSYKEFDNEKKFLPIENSPPPPHNVSNGRSLTDTNLIRTRHHYRQLSLSLGKAHTISSTRLIRTPINVDNGHLFLAQSTDSHRKSTLLMWTLHYQLYVVINLSFLKVKNLSVDSMSMVWALLYTR